MIFSLVVDCVIFSLAVDFWDAKTRQIPCRTRVQCGRTRQRTTDTAARASMPRPAFFFFFFHDSCWYGLDSARLVLNWADSCRLKPYRAKLLIQTEIQKKKKKVCKTHRLNLKQTLKGLNSLRHSHFVQTALSHSSPFALYLSVSVSPVSPQPLSHIDSHTQSHSQLTLTLTQSHSQPHRPTLNLKFST